MKRIFNIVFVSISFLVLSTPCLAGKNKYGLSKIPDRKTQKNLGELTQQHETRNFKRKLNSNKSQPDSISHFTPEYVEGEIPTTRNAEHRADFQPKSFGRNSSKSARAALITALFLHQIASISGAEVPHGPSSTVAATNVSTCPWQLPQNVEIGHLAEDYTKIEKTISTKVDPIESPEVSKDSVESVVDDYMKENSPIYAQIKRDRISREEIKEIIQLHPKIVSVTRVPGGMNKSFIVVDDKNVESRVKIFDKSELNQFQMPELKLSKNFGVEHEVAASKLASEITGGLAVEVRGSSDGKAVTSPSIKLDPVESKRIFLPDSREFHQRMNGNQKAQLFVNFAADLLLGNDDLHDKQFAIDNGGNVRSFDKGRSYTNEYLFTRDRPSAFNTYSEDSAFWYENLYIEFLDHFNFHRNGATLKELLHNKEVRQMFAKVDELAQDENLLKNKMYPLWSRIKKRIDVASKSDVSIKDMEESFVHLFRNFKPFLAEKWNISEDQMNHLLSEPLNQEAPKP